MAGNLAGTYEGRFVVDRGQLPRTTEGGEMSHHSVEIYSKIKLTIVLDGTNHFTVLEKMTSSNKSMTAEGTFVRNGSELTMTYSKVNGKTPGPEDKPLKCLVSKNERNLKFAFAEGSNKELAWFDFNKKVEPLTGGRREGNFPPPLFRSRGRDAS